MDAERSEADKGKPTRRKRTPGAPGYLPPLVYLLVGLIVYANAFDVPFVFDDISIIRDNPSVRVARLDADGLSSLATLMTQPRALPMSSFAVNYFFHRYSLFGYHLVNILTHIGVAILAYGFFYLLLRLSRQKRRLAFPIAFFAGLLWLTHPTQAQSVTYIVQRMNVMSALFFLGCLLFYLTGRIKSFRHGLFSFPTLWRFGASGVCAVMAVECKEQTIVAPVAVFLLEWYFFQNFRARWIKWGCYVSLGGAALATLCGLSAAFLCFAARVMRDYQYFDFGVGERLMTQTRVIARYLSLFFWPNPSRFVLDYDFPVSRSLLTPPTTLWALALIVGLLVLALVFRRREKLLSFCVLWYFLNLAVESSILPIDLVFEHRLYIPSMGLCLGVAILAARISPRPKAFGTALGVIAAIFGIWTCQRNFVWGSAINLWSDNVAKMPRALRSLCNKGAALTDAGRYNDAIACFTEALRVSPTWRDVHYNWGKCLEKQGDAAGAIRLYREATRLHPNTAHAFIDWGALEEKRGALSLAERLYRKSLIITPNNPTARFNLGNVLFRSGRLADAEKEYLLAIRLNPENAEAQCNLGNVYLVQKKYAEAAIRYREALTLKPDFAGARGNLALAEKAGRRDTGNKTEGAP